MVAIKGGSSQPSFADLVAAVPQPIPEMVLAPRIPKLVDGEVFFQFTKEEIARSTKLCRFSVVLKFLKQRPSLDAVRSFIHSRWGLSSTPVVSFMWCPRNVFVRMMSEADFTKALSREVCEINGSFYRPFRWSPDFDEDAKPSRVPVWVYLPGLPPNFYQESFLNILMMLIGSFIRCDNPTRCATRTDGARLCVEVDAAKPPLSHFWIGAPGLPSSRKQEVIYETLPAYCNSCKMQGHNSQTCRGKSGQHGNGCKGTKDKQEKGQPVAVNGEGMKEKETEINRPVVSVENMQSSVKEQTGPESTTVDLCPLSASMGVIPICEEPVGMVETQKNNVLVINQVENGVEVVESEAV
ncbi:uncharacterized protein LOC122309374 [Carya illinoinensis]|uniref:uncharacterized protein LOC122309374 n=1 Tax=Carya illinoinensis TaxID=32201 RepID=UPI001C719950|nr:uncharacterized protein LOC122309374 [Carya illinoinensis]